jgi:PAS domain S-box-containing protein
LEDLCRQRAEFRRYGDVVETAQDAVVTIDESHRILFFNRAAEVMFGFSKGEVIGQDLSLVIPTPHKKQHRDYVRRYVETRSGRFINHTVELTAERRSGEEFPISISFSVAEERGHLLMTAIMRDMTQLKSLEHRALQNERLVSVGQALSYVTHEVKNPLVVIGGFARFLLRGDSIQGEERKKLDIIVKEVQRLEGLIEEIQDFTKPLRLEKEQIHLAPFLREVGEALALLGDSETSPQVGFSLEVEGDPVIIVDPGRLRQVILNLVKNAVEAIGDRGKVMVRAWQDAGSVAIKISDTGEGIPPERLGEIFQPFVTTKRGGSGLGLPLCRKIVRDHGGEITISSQPGEGTQVKLSFPSNAP